MEFHVHLRVFDSRCASVVRFLDVGSNGALAPFGDYDLIVREAKAGIL